jgi:hypothetical protein
MKIPKHKIASMISKLKNPGLVGLSTALALLMLISASALAAPVPHYRTLRPPRVLMLVENSTGMRTGLAWEQDSGARVTTVQLGRVNEDVYHLCDKPLESVKADYDYIDQRIQTYLDDRIAHLNDYDLVIAEFGTHGDPHRTEVMEKLAAWVRAGGKLISVGTDFAGTPLQDLMPIRVDPKLGNAWAEERGRATDAPLVRGVPLDTLGNHAWEPVYAPYDQTAVLLTEHPRYPQDWYRELPGGGKVVFLLEDHGSQWLWNGQYATSSPQRPDDNAAWRQFARRLVYGLVYGDKAFPVLARITPAAGASGQYGVLLALPVDVENRSGEPRTVDIRMQLLMRRGGEHTDAVQPVTLAAGERRTLNFNFTPELPANDPYLLAHAVVVSDDGREQLSEASSWLPFTATVPVTLATDHPGYRTGAPIQATVAWKSGAPGKYTLDCALADYQGRVLQRKQVPVTVGAAAGSSTVGFTMPGAGPQVCFAYYITALLRSGKQVAGSARAQVQLDDPWSMRRQLQFSVWGYGGRPDFMTLMQDAGMNTLGYPGSTTLAERYNMHQYVEGTGINTFGVTIDYDNWNDVRKAMEAQMDAAAKAGPDSRSKSLVSLGEESGFKNGWGERYYWDTPQAPPLVQKVFDEYLNERYNGDIARLNKEWGANYASFSDVPLLKSNVQGPSTVFVGAQAWAALADKDKQGKFPVEFDKVDSSQPYLARTAPFVESVNFFDWYYQKYCDLAMATYRTHDNPVPLSVMSAPGGFYPKVDVHDFNGAGPFYPKEWAAVNNEIARRDIGDVPGFSGAMWEYFDLKPLWDAVIYGNLLQGDTHLDYWVDFPLTFNPDITHDRSTLWTKELRHKIRPIEPILLHKRVACTPGLGMFVGSQPLGNGLVNQFNSSLSPNAPAYSALEESGYLPRVVKTSDLKDMRVLVTSYAQSISPTEGKQITDFVHNGGTLIATPWLGSCTSHGNALTVYPSAETGLDKLLGFHLLQTSQSAHEEDFQAALPFGDKPATITLNSHSHDGVQDIAPDVKVLARYKDGTPALLTRSVGKGRVVYLNFIYDWHGWWNSFAEPSREAYRKLFENIVQASGIKRDYYLAFDSMQHTTEDDGWWGTVDNNKPAPGESIPWWYSMSYADSTGRIKYLAVMTDERSPIITANVWIPNHARIYDLFTGKAIDNSGSHPPKLTLHPGQAAFWAILPAEPAPLTAKVTPTVKAGSPITLTLRTNDSADRGAMIDVFDAKGTRHPEYSVANAQLSKGAATIAIPTALNDQPGSYRAVVTDSINRRQTAVAFRIIGTDGTLLREVYQPFPPALPNDTMAPAMSDDEFLSKLRSLRDVYLGSYSGLDNKYQLSYYLFVLFEPENRHGLMRQLQRTDWAPHLKAVADALRHGEHFVLDAEDLNIDPASGLKIDPFAVNDPPAFLDQLAAQPGAHRHTAKINGLTFDIIELGSGSVVVCRDSVDRAAYRSVEFAAWQTGLKTALQTLGISPPVAKAAGS